MISLVTGANGFVGSHLVELLLERGHRVRCLVRRTSNLRWLDTDRVELTYGEVREPGSLEAALRDVRYVFHVAGITRARRLEDFQRVNVDGTRHLAEACARHAGSLERLVYCSSLAAGGPAGSPEPIDERDPPAPLSTYGRTKYEGEVALREVGAALPHVVVRPPVIYGPRDVALLSLFRAVRRGLIPTVGHGERLLSMIHVRDVARALLLAAEKGKPAGVYYVSDGEIHRWTEIGKKVAETLGRRARVVTLPRSVLWGAAVLFETLDRLGGPAGPVDREKVRRMLPRVWICSDERARRELGYATSRPLGQGLHETAAWYRAQGWLPAGEGA
jgi:nucleoside-diphosphate-sugar epimerase